jgi:restriction system-associated AAA family ATPase
MKLISVKILGEDFRSLKNNKLYSFNVNERTGRLSTKVFAGLNGSGKSNFLELLAEIFFYLEKYHLRTVSAADKKGKNIGFEIEYLLPVKVEIPFDDTTKGLVEKRNEWQHVRITKPLEGLPEFSSKVLGFKMEQPNNEGFIRHDEFTESLLPKKIIAYTSGQNELLSNPFFKIRYHYFKETAKKATPESPTDTINDRLFFLDSSSNFSIFVSNMLLADADKLKYLKKIFAVEDLHSFRITINWLDYGRKKIAFGGNNDVNIEKLKLCATSWIKRTKGKEEFLILDFRVSDATHEAFKFHFKTSFELFKALYDLENLNLHLVKSDTRNLIPRAHKSLNLSDELPKPDPSRLIFRVEKVNLNKIVEDEKPPRKIYYKGLSDGEHQFNEVIGSVMMMEQEGCLFLMDEPDTHFNPVWRAQMIKMLNFVAATEFEERERDKLDSNNKVVLGENKKPVREKYLFPIEVRRQEIIITTHSPFVISDSQTEDVYKFDKVKGEVVYINPKIETYGASVSLLLQEIFDRRISISDLSNYDLEELREALKELKKPKVIKAKIEEIRVKLVDFGESIEKFDLYSLLSQIEKDIDNKKKKQ